MNVTKDVITDLYPLYAEKECSADTRALVEEYLHQHPAEAAELRKALSDLLPKSKSTARDLGEIQALQAARRVVRRRSWVLGFAIFFSLAPFSFQVHNGEFSWLFAQSIGSAAFYLALAAIGWIFYAILRRRSSEL